MKTTSPIVLLYLSISFLALNASRGTAAEPFTLRGYYMTFMRMPTFGLAEWREMIDDMEEDGANTLLLWTAGGFRSRRFPVTWQYNREHKNVKQDFVRELIDYAHRKRIKVLLGFTPFAYDGTNQYPLEYPKLKATQKNGQPAPLWGMHCWGYNLCPAKEESQRFMFDYVREMFLDFYPNADGLLMESSDYAICYCTDCRERFFDREFSFVRRISDEIWKTRPGAMIIVYPHYFTGRPVPGFGVAGAKRAFDPRWTLFFTPHSAQIDPGLVRQARSSVFWNDGLTLGTPARIRDGARQAWEAGITGYIPSLEPFSCVDGPPGSGKARQKPFHFEWLPDGQMPLNELLIRVNRFAYREFSRDPGLSDSDFRKAFQEHFFGAIGAAAEQERAADDLLYLQETWFLEADWFKPSPLLEPSKLKALAGKEDWPAEERRRYTSRIDRMREISRRYEHFANPAEQEMRRIATLLVNRWQQ